MVFIGSMSGSTQSGAISGVVEDSSGNIRDLVKIVEDRTDDDGNINVTLLSIRTERVKS